MILLSVFCVVLSLEFGVSTPHGNKFKESRLQNEDNNVERNIGEATDKYNQPNNPNELISQENQKRMLMQNEDYEQFNTNTNPAAFRNINQPSNVIYENKDYNQINDQRNFNSLKDESSRPLYIASPPQVNRIHTFLPKNGVDHEANITRMGDIISEVNNVKKSPIESNLQDGYPANPVINRQNLREPENIDDKKEDEDGPLSDAPAAKPEYTKSIFNEYSYTQKNNVKSTNANFQRYDISNKNFQTNSQNEATFQNPSAEILYETGQARPYEISDEPLHNTPPGNTHAQNILNDKQRLKNLYLSSKPTKHYMIVYPDGRVEQVDQLDKIQKMHPNYVMLNAKELLQHGKPNQKVSTLSQESVMKQNLPITTTTTTTVKPQLNSVEDSKDDQIDKVPQTVDEQTLPVPVEPIPVASESSTISTSEVTKTTNVSKSSKDKVETKLSTQNKIQKQFKVNEVNDRQKQNKLNKNENTNFETIVTTSDISSIPVSTTAATESPVIDDTVTTVRSTLSTSTENTEFLNQNISNSPEMLNNTVSSNLLQESENSNTGENTTPTPKQELNEEDERTKNTTTITFDLNTIQDNSYTPEQIETSNVNNETNTSLNSTSSLDFSSNREESNSITKPNNATMITFEDGKDGDGNTFHTETIITNYNNASKVENTGSNNVTSSQDSTSLVTDSNKTDDANYSTEDAQNNTNPLNVTSSNSLTNSTLDIPGKDENNTDIITIQIVSDITNSEMDGTKKEANTFKPNTPEINSDATYKDASSHNTSDEAYEVSSTQEETNSNKTFISTVTQDDFKNNNSSTDEADALSTGISDVLNKEDYTATNVFKDYKVKLIGGAVPSNEEDNTDTVTNDSYYSNFPQNGITDDDEDDDNNETRPDTNNMNDTNDSSETETPSSDGNGVSEPSFWFNAGDSFWNKLMNSNEQNSFYFLFPRPKPNTIDTKKTIYPNGTVVIETTETVDNGDGETTSSKTVFKCENFTTCENTL